MELENEKRHKLSTVDLLNGLLPDKQFGLNHGFDFNGLPVGASILIASATWFESLLPSW
jgi:hypothetical protein